MTPPEPHIAERISANTIVLRICCAIFNRNCWRRSTAFATSDLISLYERIRGDRGQPGGVEHDGWRTLSTARRLEGDVRALAAGLPRSRWPTRYDHHGDSRRYELEIEAMRRELERTNAYAEQLAAAARATTPPRLRASAWI